MYIKDGTLYFSSGRPSNFWLAPIILPDPIRGGEETYPHNECYFHICKVACVGDFTANVDGQQMGPYELRDAIYYSGSPREAKRLGHLVPFTTATKELWDTRSALVAMVECNLAKYQQNFDCWLWLQETSGLRLVEHRRDPIWGDNLDGSGKNQLGHVLELVRAATKDLTRQR